MGVKPPTSGIAIVRSAPVLYSELRVQNWCAQHRSHVQPLGSLLRALLCLSFVRKIGPAPLAERQIKYLLEGRLHAHCQ